MVNHKVLQGAEVMDTSPSPSLSKWNVILYISYCKFRFHAQMSQQGFYPFGNFLINIYIFDTEPTRPPGRLLVSLCQARHLLSFDLIRVGGWGGSKDAWPRGFIKGPPLWPSRWDIQWPWLWRGEATSSGAPLYCETVLWRYLAPRLRRLVTFGLTNGVLRRNINHKM